MKRLSVVGVMVLGLLAAAAASAHPEPDAAVVPADEYERARELAAAGPEATHGVESVRDLGALPLAGEFDAPPDDRILRARELTIAPGGVVAVHEHNQRPGVAYILEGELFEHRSDRDEPERRQQGDTAFEYTGLLHWWENRSDAPARALVIDIVPAPDEPGD